MIGLLMGLVVVTPPAQEPVTVDEAAAHLRVLATGEEGLLARLVQAGRERLEIALRRHLLETTLDWTLDTFPADPFGDLEVPRPPLRSLVSVTFLDGNGLPQAIPLSSLDVETAREPGRIRPVPGTLWPVVQFDRLAPVTVRFRAGYGTTPATVPAELRTALLLLVGQLYEHRENLAPTPVTLLPDGVDRIVWRHRWGDYPA